MFTEKTLAHLSPPQLCRAFKRAYHGYTVTLPFTEEWVRNHIERNSIVLSESPLWLDDKDDPVALAALGVRDKRGWIGAFGLAPEVRGKGLAAPLLDAIMTRAEDLKLSHLQLEVLQSNARAFRTYQSHGFETSRKVVTLSCPIDFSTGPLEGARLCNWDRIPVGPVSEVVWQRELPFAAPAQAEALVSPNAWVRFYPRGKGIVVIDGKARDTDSLGALMADLRHRFPFYTLTASNEPVGSALYFSLTSLEWLESNPQWEMRCELET